MKIEHFTFIALLFITFFTKHPFYYLTGFILGYLFPVIAGLLIYLTELFESHGKSQ